VSEVLDLFLELAAEPSPPGDERAVADHVLRYLRDCGLQPEEDDAGPAIASNAGNVFVRLEPTAAGEPVFLCAHFDTVPPTDAIRPVVEDGVVRNAQPTILGGDNKAAIAVMLEATRRVLAENRPHAGLELVFTPKEEVGLLGAYAFDHTRLSARTGYVYDQAAAIGEVIVGAPAAHQLDIVFHGRAAHAGMYPEEGRSAVAAAARAISEMRLGRVDEETTANIGRIRGGTAANIIPEWCTLVGEARSHDERKLADLVQEMQDAVTFAAGVAEVQVETKVKRTYRAYRFKRGDLAVRLAADALERCGFAPSYGLSGGAADANVFNERGLQCVNLANGMAEIHTPDEYIAVADLEAMVEVTLALLDAAARSSSGNGANPSVHQGK
jgi:tripeptide aminopeptidase